MPLVSFKRRAEGAKHEGQSFMHLDLRSMKAFGSVWTNCTFDLCKMDLADLRTAKFEGCTFDRCEMRLVNFSTSYFDHCKFDGCDLEQASFSGCQLSDVLFSDCRLAYGETMFQDVTVKTRLEFDSCNLHGSNLDFREAPMGTLVFKDSNLWGAKMAFGCALFNASVDEKMQKQFLALVSRVYPDERVKELAGDYVGLVGRLMDERK